LHHIAIGHELVVKTLLRGHPVAEEHIHLAVFEPAKGNRHRQGVDLGFVAHARQQKTGDGIGGGNIAPARIGHFYGFTAGVCIHIGAAQHQHAHYHR